MLYFKHFLSYIFNIVLTLLVKLTRNYYTSFNKIKLFNFWQVKEGKLNYLYRIRFKYFPVFFYKVAENMVYQMEYINLDLQRMEAKEARLRALYVLTKRPDFLNKANFEKAKIDDKKKIKVKSQKLNEFIDIIELTFNDIGKIDPYKIRAGRAFSLFNKASEIHKRKMSHVNN